MTHQFTTIYQFTETYSTGEPYTYKALDVFDDFEEAVAFAKDSIKEEYSILKDEGVSWIKVQVKELNSNK